MPASWMEAAGDARRQTPLGPRPPLGSILREDLLANAPELEPDASAAAWVKAIARHVPTMRFSSVVAFRLAQAAGHAFAPAGSILKQLNHLIFGCDIAWQAEVGGGLMLFHPTGVVIGPECRVGPRCAFMQGVTLGSTPAGSPVLGEDVFLGPGTRVLGPATVGDHAIVGANSVVLGDVEDGGVAVGAPARVVRNRLA